MSTIRSFPETAEPIQGSSLEIQTQLRSYHARSLKPNKRRKDGFSRVLASSHFKTILLIRAERCFGFQIKLRLPRAQKMG
jgi:hypothetical protein